MRFWAGRLTTRINAAVPLGTWEKLRDVVASKRFGTDGRGDFWLRVGMLKGLVSTGVDLSRWKAHLERNPFDVKPAFLASRTTARLLPETILGRPSRSPELPQWVIR